jgi:hypothetical protein
MKEHGKERKSAEWEVANAIGRFLENPTPLPGFDTAWFASLLTKKTSKDPSTRLKSTYTKHLKRGLLLVLAIQPRDDY